MNALARIDQFIRDLDASPGLEATARGGKAGASGRWHAAYSMAPNAEDFMASPAAAFSPEARAEMGDDTGGAGLVKPTAPPSTLGAAPGPAGKAPDDTWRDPATDAWAGAPAGLRSPDGQVDRRWTSRRAPRSLRQ